MRNLTLFLGILLALAIILRLDFVFYIVYVLAGLWLLAQVGFKHVVEKLEWDRKYSNRAFLGDKVGIEVAVRNRRWLPLPWLRISDSVPVNLFGGEEARQLTSLAARAQYKFRYQLECNRRGYYTIGPLILTGGDTLGLIEVPYHPASQSHLIVYPQIYPLTQLGLDSRQPFGILRSRQRLFEDPARLAGIRDYQTGDSIRSIHWKATAHADALQVKKLEPAIALESAILLNLNREEYRREWVGPSEWGISLAASLAYHLTQAGQAVGLTANGLDPLHDNQAPQSILPNTGQSHLMQILDVLARVAAGRAQLFDHWIGRATLKLNWGTTLLVITPKGNEAVMAALHRQARRGFDIVVLVTEPYDNFAPYQARARRLGMRAYNLTKDYELKQWAQGRQNVHQATT